MYGQVADATVSESEVEEQGQAQCSEDEGRSLHEELDEVLVHVFLLLSLIAHKKKGGRSHPSTA